MIKTSIQDLSPGTLDFSYNVEGADNNTSTTNTGNSITMTILEATSVSFISNKDTSGVDEGINGIVKVQLSNSESEVTGDVYLTIEGVTGNFSLAGVRKEGESNITAVDSKYNVGTIGIDSNIIVEIEISYTQGTPGENITLTIKGYEETALDNFDLTDITGLVITANFAVIEANLQIGRNEEALGSSSLDVIVGDTIYVLTTITNTGNVDTITGAQFQQTFNITRLENVFYAHGISEPENIDLNTEATAQPIDFTIPAIAKTTGVYYVKVKATVKAQ